MCDSRYQFKKTNWAQNFRPPSQCKILPPSSFRKFELISFKQSPKALKSARMYNMSNILDLGRVVLWHNFSSLRPIRFKLILAHDFIVKITKIQSVFSKITSFGLKMMLKNGLEKFILKFLHAENFLLLHFYPTSQIQEQK